MHYPQRLGEPFWRLWTATGLSSLGDGMVLVGFPLLAVSYTHSAFLIAGVLVAGQLPALFSLPVGALADRLNRRRLLVTLELLRFAVLGAFGVVLLSGSARLWIIYVASFALGSLTLGYDLTAGAVLADMVPDDQLVRANARLAMVDATSEEVAGQALGGFVFALARSVPFLADAASFLVSAALLRRSIPDVPASHPAVARTALMDDLREGLGWFWSHHLLRRMAGLVGSMAFCQSAVLALLVLYGSQDLHLSKTGYGLILGIGAVANVVGGAAATSLHARLGPGWCIVAGGLAAACAYPILAGTHSPVVACGALALESMAVMVGIVAARSLRQSLVPRELQARVGSAYQMVILVAIPLGGLTGGLLAGVVGIRSTFLYAGCLQVAVVAVATPKLLAHLSQAKRPKSAEVSEPIAA